MTDTSNLVSEVLAHQFNSARYSDLIIRWFNEGQKKIYRRAKLRSSLKSINIALEADEYAYTLPFDYSKIDRLINPARKYILTQIEQIDWDDLSSTSSEPEAYTVFANEIYLYPTPNKVSNLILRYYSLPSTISLSTNPELPDDYYYLLIEYAVMKCYEAEHDFNAAEFHRNNFDFQLLNLQSETTEDSREAPKQIKGAW